MIAALAVKYPSVIAFLSSSFSKFLCFIFAILIPKFVFRDYDELHVNIKSPKPDKPKRVSFFDLKNLANREISTNERVIRALLAFSPKFKPSEIPAAIAYIFSVSYTHLTLPTKA